MFYRVPEKQMHLVRWLLAVGWLILIFSLFYDPVSAYLTQPENAWSLFSLNPQLFDPEACEALVTVRGQCLPEQPYPLGAKIFWGMVVPAAILVLLFLGHETWRRICPLSFMSQISRALGKQRQRKKVNPKTQAIRYELAKVRKDSWLARNHLYLQFFLLCLGLCIRILFVNSNRLLLGIFLIFTILSAIVVGYFYSGKSWCQYFCPMAPVEMILTGPRGLFGSEAHQGERKKITQSTCRTIDKSGKEKNACVGCQSPCIDIDAERNYWEQFNKPGRRFIHYGYLGLVLGFYLYYFLYSGTFKYFYSGVTNHEENQLQTVFDPGFYLFGHAILIPKLVAVPLTIGVFVIVSYWLSHKVEKSYKSYRHRIGKPLTQRQIQHQIFTISTFIVLNLYFIFGGRPFLKSFPTWVELMFNGAIAIASTLWMYRTLNRSAEIYSRESLSNSLRRQLSKLNIDFSKFLEGRSMNELKPDEVYVLAKVLPSFSKDSSLQVYKGVLRDALEQGNVQPSNSFERLEQLRLELGIKDEEHYNLLTELGLENPDLLDPNKSKTKETKLRLDSYQEALELQLLDLLEMGVPLNDAIARRDRQIQMLKQEYGITVEEEEELLERLADPGSVVAKKAEGFLDLLRNLDRRDRALQEKVNHPDDPEFGLLRSLGIHNKQQIVLQKLFCILEVLGDSSDAINIATSLIKFSALSQREEMLSDRRNEFPWSERLDDEVFAILQSPQVIDEEETLPEAIAVIEELLQELEPLMQATALYTLNKLDPQQAREQAEQFLNSESILDDLVRETAERITGKDKERLPKIPTLVVRVTVKGETREEAIQKPLIRVGRSPSNDIVLDDSKVSKQHALFYLDDKGATVAPSGSAYGLRIGNRLLQQGNYRLDTEETIHFSRAQEPAIAVRWEEQLAQSGSLDNTLGTIEKLLLLLEIELFQAVKPEASIELARESEICLYPQGVRLCEQGDPANELFLLIEGAADATVFQGDKEVTINTISSGTAIGEMGILTRQARSANVITSAKQNRVLVVKAENFEAALAKDAEVTKQLLLEAIARLQRLTARVQSMS